VPRLVCECARNACCSGAAGCFESLRPRARATEKTYKQRAQPPRPRDPHCCCVWRAFPDYRCTAVDHSLLLQLFVYCAVVCRWKGFRRSRIALVKLALCRVDDFTSAAMAKLVFHQFSLCTRSVSYQALFLCICVRLCSCILHVRISVLGAVEFSHQKENEFDRKQTQCIRGWSQIIIIYNSLCDLIRLYASIYMHQYIYT